jgi:hypothetical protein
MSECIVFEGPFAYAGDRLVKEYELGRHTMTLTAEIEIDNFSADENEDIEQNRKRIEAFNCGEAGSWCFLDVVVSLAINGEEIESASLSEEHLVGDDPRWLLYAANYLVGQLDFPLRAMDDDALAKARLGVISCYFSANSGAT